MKAFFALSRQEKGWFIQAWWHFLIWHLRINYSRYASWQPEIFTQANKDAPIPKWVNPLILTIEKASRHHLRHMNCLRRCMVAKTMLNKRGVHPELIFGVKTTPQGKLEAHCWLTLNQTPINDSLEELAKYTELQVSDSATVYRCLF